MHVFLLCDSANKKEDIKVARISAGDRYDYCQIAVMLM